MLGTTNIKFLEKINYLNNVLDILNSSGEFEGVLEIFFVLYLEALYCAKVQKKGKIRGTLALFFRFVCMQRAPAIKAYNHVLSKGLKLSNLCSNHQACIQIAGPVLSFWLLCDVEYFHIVAIMLPLLVPQLVSDRADVTSLLSESTCRWRLELSRRRMWQKRTKKSFVCFFWGAEQPPQWVRASSFKRFLDHTQ